MHGAGDVRARGVRLGSLDLNQNCGIQSAECYRYTTPQSIGSEGLCWDRNCWAGQYPIASRVRTIRGFSRVG